MIVSSIFRAKALHANGDVSQQTVAVIEQCREDVPSITSTEATTCT